MVDPVTRTPPATRPAEPGDRRPNPRGRSVAADPDAAEQFQQALARAEGREAAATPEAPAQPILTAGDFMQIHGISTETPTPSAVSDGAAQKLTDQSPAKPGAERK